MFPEKDAGHFGAKNIYYAKMLQKLEYKGNDFKAPEIFLTKELKDF